jgi:hypothetical protein
MEKHSVAGRAFSRWWTRQIRDIRDGLRQSHKRKLEEGPENDQPHGSQESVQRHRKDLQCIRVLRDARVGLIDPKPLWCIGPVTR